MQKGLIISQMKNFIKKYAPLLLTLLIMAIGFIFAYINRHQLSLLSSLQFLDVALITVLIFIAFVISGYTFYLLMDVLSIKLSVLEMTGLTFITNFGNYMGPARPGAALKALYLKGQKGLPYARFSAVLAANGFIISLVSGSTGVLTLGILWLKTGFYSFLLIAVCLVLVIVSLLPFILPISTIKRSGRIWRALNRAITGFREIKKQKKKLLRVCGPIIVQYILVTIIIKMIYGMLYQDIPIISALVIGVFRPIANFYTITPNNLGIQETITAYLFLLTGHDFTVGMICAGVIRVIHMALTFGLTPIFAYLLLKPAGMSLSAILPGRKSQL